MMYEAIKSPGTTLGTLTTVDFVQSLHKVCMPARREGTDDSVPGQIKTKPNRTFSSFEGRPILRSFVSPDDARSQLQELMS